MGERFTKEEAHAEQKKAWGKRAIKRHGERMKYIINFKTHEIRWAECHTCSIGLVDGKPDTFTFYAFDNIPYTFRMTDLIGRKASLVGREDF